MVRKITPRTFETQNTALVKWLEKPSVHAIKIPMVRMVRKIVKYCQSRQHFLARF